jgi:N-acyl-D-amino-acid deacylase
VKTAKNQDAVGLNLVQLGELRGKDPYNATFDLLFEEENAVGMVDFYGTEEHVIKFLCRPEQKRLYRWLDGAGKPHPRVWRIPSRAR